MWKRLGPVGLVLVAVLGIACGTDDGGRQPGEAGSGQLASSAAMGPGLTIAEARDSNLDGPLLVNGYVVATGEEVRLCAALAESSPPQCGGESLTVEGLDPRTVTDAKTEAGTTWTDAPIQVLGTVHGDVLSVDEDSVG